MPEEKIINSLGLECDKKGYIKVDENYETSMKNVYAGGDVIGSRATVAWAARTGRDVAEIIVQRRK
jgi:pyruvate/2-oxoglutarate dehydrogenase complex dihydrolipoamide dehydrogenase (E3) component